MAENGIGRLARLSQTERSALMSTIRSKDTKPEMLVRHYLHGLGMRYRLHDTKLPGKPDIVLPGRRVVVFVQGCFWHWHGDACGIRPGKPRTNRAQWETKLQGNVARDEKHRLALQAAGWRVLVVWECELKRGVRGATLHRLTSEITAADDLPPLEIH
ncbi:very short patch repair endonuclease [Hymenobacter antarcticus]|uniref:Very short patch repair endonuclease n=1 Tax=Hymenobacter antarcticus TaxID=486270 RepID=A0ABP7PLA8_9BACT